MGSFLMMTCFLCTTISSGMFITAMAANPLAVNLAAETLGYTISWGESLHRADKRGSAAGRA